VDGLIRRPHKVVGEAGDLSLLFVFRGGVGRGTGGLG